MKGFIQGSLWGVVLGGAGLSFASLVSDLPDYASGPAAPQLAAPELATVTPGPAVAFEANDDTAPTFSTVDPLEEVQDSAGPAPEVSTEPAVLPQTADVAVSIASPEAATVPGVSTIEDAPVAPRVETALVEPETTGVVPDVDNAPAPALEDAPTEETETAAVVEEDATPDRETSAVEEATVSEAETESVVEEPTTAPEPVVIAEAPTTETGTASVAEEPAADPETVVVETIPAPAPAEENSEPTETVVEAPAPTETDDTPGAPVTVTEVLPQTTTAVRINRPTEVETPEEPLAVADDATAIPDDAPALLRFAVPFEQTDAPSKVSIVLIDDGEMPDAVTAIANLGFVPTVSVNALSAASTDLAAAYRAAGIEVAMQARLPEGAQPADVEVAFEAALRQVPYAALLVSDGTGAMQNRAVTAQVMEVLAADGYGFVTVQRGLSNAARAAEQAGVSAATVLRDIDGAGENAQAITLALNQAAFRARQSGEAVLLGRVRAETLAALQDWAADLDQSTLAIAPVSAILLSED